MATRVWWRIWLCSLAFFSCWWSDHQSSNRDIII
jgi:hypothetical protein